VEAGGDVVTKPTLMPDDRLFDSSSLRPEVAIFAACREASGKPWYEVDASKVSVRNIGGLNELKIARIVGAAGVRPYLLRASRNYTFTVTGGHYAPLRSNENSDTMTAVHREAAGAFTWPLVHLFCNFCGPYEYRTASLRTAMRALADAGLLVEHRDEFHVGEWLPRAYLAPPGPVALVPEQMDIDDEAAIFAIAL
jgi:hypothetical protein